MKRILIVDDEEDLVQHLMGIVQRQGWEAGAADDGVAAVLKVMDGGWDAVLMDIRMPNLDGFGALKLIRRYNAQLPVVVFTGQAGQGDMMNARRLGAYACLLKPAEGEQIVQALTAAMAQPV